MAIRIGKTHRTICSVYDTNGTYEEGYRIGVGNFYITGGVGGLVGTGLFDISNLEGGFANKVGTTTGAPVDFYIGSSTSFPNSFSLPNQNNEVVVVVFGTKNVTPLT